MMTHLGTEIANVCLGSVEIRLPHRNEALQQHGLFHCGATTTISDSAGRYAAMHCLSQTKILRVKYKINFLAPAIGDQIVANGQVVKLSKNLSAT
jgi:uncharacterized protein (TIGR00369 family)